jgi:ferredoxin-NADP reductase
VVGQIEDHGNQVYTLELIPEKSIPAFRPGQFLHLALDGYDPSGFWPDSRAFSIASSPAQRDTLRISYSVKGKFTARMERELIKGKEVWVKLPYGEFLVDDKADVVLVAGGTGITAFSAFIEALLPDQSRNIYLFYGARSVDLLIYREKISRIARCVPCFHPEYFVEVAPEDETEPDLRPAVGRLSIATILAQLPNPLNVIYYLSGPPVMLKSFSNELLIRGVPAGCICTDAWE